MAFEDAQAAPRLHVPQPHGLVPAAGKITLSIWTERVGVDFYLGVEVEPDGPFCNLPARDLCFRHSRFRCWTAGIEELHILLLAVLLEPANVEKLRQGTFDGGLVELQGNEAVLLVQRVAKPKRLAFQHRLVGAERLRRHAEHEHAGVLQPCLDLRRDAVTGAQHPLIEPDAQIVGAQPFRNCGTTALSLEL